MSHPYDASTKYLVETRLADWLPLCGRATTAPVEVIEADLATVTAAADRVLRVHESPPWLLHLELQSSRDPSLPVKLQLYNTLLGYRHSLPVRSVVVLLRRSTEAANLTGVLQQQFPGEAPYLTFHYQTVRVWQMPVDTFLKGGLGVLPLAPLADVTEADLPGVISHMEQRLRQEATPEEAGILLTATDILMGLRYPQNLADQLLQGVHAMEDSVTYQAIIKKGAVRDRQDVLLQQGQKQFGPPSEAVIRELRGITDLERLIVLTDRILDVSSWDELLAAP